MWHYSFGPAGRASALPQTSQRQSGNGSYFQAGADLRSSHLCTCGQVRDALGRWGPCHMVLKGPWWKSIKKSSHYSCQNGMFCSFKLCTVDKVHAVRPVDNYNDMPFPRQKFDSLNDWNTLKTHFVALRMFDSSLPPETPTGFWNTIRY